MLLLSNCGFSSLSYDSISLEPFMKPDGIITQKTKISISTAVETSNLIHITAYIKSNVEFYQKIMQELWLK